MEEAIKIGIVIMAVSPLAPLVTGKMAKAGVDTSFAVGLYVALIFFAVIIVPATVALLSALYPPDASISVPSVIGIVVKSVLAPLALGLVVGTIAPAFSRPLAKWFTLVGNVGLILILMPILFVHFTDIVALVGDGAILAIAAAVSGGIVAGHWLGGPTQQGRTAIALAASMRHPGIALLITRQNFTDPQLVPAIELFLLISIALSSLYLLWLKKRTGAVQSHAAAL
jgi:BASS family bile acid:Na+ symporter